jgi:hypothetical protein
METLRTIIYDDKTAGRKVVAFPPKLPFAPYLNQLKEFTPIDKERKIYEELSVHGSVYARADALSEYLSASSEPHKEILHISALAAVGEAAGLRLMYAALLAVPSIEMFVEDMGDFPNVRRLMERIAKKKQTGVEVKESEEWFKKKVILLATSHPLPNAGAAPDDQPWLGWSEGVRLGVISPDKKWEKGILERVKAELEARDHRIKTIVTRLDPEKRQILINTLLSASEDVRWKISALDKTEDQLEGNPLVLRSMLKDRWESIQSGLRESEVGAKIADLFVVQAGKIHSHPQMKNGMAILHAMIMHPLLQRRSTEPDFLSCLELFIAHGGRGIIEIMIQKGVRLDQLLELAGFEFEDRIVRIDLGRVPPAFFVDDDEMPKEVNWTDIKMNMDASYKSLVLIYIDNDNFLADLLDNPKAISKPGVVPLIAQRSRSLRILTIIANRRDLYTGFANKQVPVNLLMNPSKVPLSALRKFVHVRYVDKMTLQRMSNRGSSVREEIRREIGRYVNSV